MKKAVRGWEIQSWKSDKERHEGLKEYPKEELGKREEYLNYTKTSKMLCKFRLDDLGSRGEMSSVWGGHSRNTYPHTHSLSRIICFVLFY